MEKVKLWQVCFGNQLERIVVKANNIEEATEKARPREKELSEGEEIGVYEITRIELIAEED
jgi:hypothetical protein